MLINKKKLFYSNIGNTMEKSENLKIEKRGGEEKNEILIKKEKSYINLYLCKLDVGLLFTFFYIFISLLLNVINRIIFVYYKFRFNFTFLFLQQFATLILFTFVANKNRIFLKEVGKISFKDFYKLKYYYLLFTLVFLLNLLVSFYGNQLTENINMFLSLRKMTTVEMFLLELFFTSKKVNPIACISVFCITCGSILIQIDGFTRDYIGCIILLIGNVFTIVYIKFTEHFRRITKISNLKLLVYCSYIANPILIVSIFVSGEYKRLIYFFKNRSEMEGTYVGLGFYLFLSCCLCIILNSTYFISNEKSSSLITELLSNSKNIFMSVFFYFFDKKKNRLTTKMIAGNIMAVFGACAITFKSLINLFISINFWKKKKKKIRKEEIEGNELEEKILENKNS